MYSKKTNNYSRNYSDGYNFEQNLIRILTDNAITQKCLKDTSGTEADVFEGTDFEFYGMPVDTTIYMEGKNHAVIFEEDAVKLSEDCTVSFGVRTGNDYGPFEKPVLLIGFMSMTHDEYQQKSARCLQAIEHNIQMLLCYGLGLYNKYLSRLA